MVLIVVGTLYGGDRNRSRSLTGLGKKKKLPPPRRTGDLERSRGTFSIQNEGDWLIKPEL